MRTSSVFSSIVGGILACAAISCSGGDDGGGTDSASTSTTSGTTTAGTGTSSGETDGMLDPGVTDCTPPGLPQVLCQAGQYCQDSVLGMCTNGCLSNANCAADQTCEKVGGANEGTCQNVGGGGPTEAEFCEKLLVCDPSGTMEQCSTIYKGTNEGCHTCVVDGNCGDINNGSCDAACGL